MPLAPQFKTLGLIALIVLSTQTGLHARDLGGDPAQVAWKLRNDGAQLRSRGQIDQSIASLEKALTLAAQARVNRRHLADIHLELALAYADNSRRLFPPRKYEAARSSVTHFEQTLKLWQNDWGISDIQRAVARLNLAHAYNQVGRFTEALPMFEFAVPQIEGWFGKDSAQLASALGGLALTYHRLQRFDDAEQTYRRVVSIYRSKKDHVRDVVLSLEMLGQMYWSKDDYDGAVGALEEAVHTGETHFGPDSPTLIGPLGTLAAVRNYQAESWRITEIYDRIAAICSKNPHADPTCEFATVRLGTASYDRGNYRDAVQHYRRWIDSLADVDLVNDPRMGMFQMISERLASMYERFADYRSAADIRARMVAVYRRDPHLSSTVPLEQLRLANDYERAKDTTRADQLYRLVLPSLEVQVRGPQGVLPAGAPPGDCDDGIALELADYYARHGQRDRAESLLENDCKEVSREIFQREYAMRLLERARFFDRVGLRSNAVTLYEQVLPIFEQMLGAENPATAHVLVALSRFALGTGDAAKARSLLERALSAYQSTLPLIMSHSAEDEQRTALDQYRSSLDLAISLDRDYSHGDPTTVAFAARTVLERKGRLLEATQAAFTALRRRSSGAAAKALDDLSRVRAERASAILPGLLDSENAVDPERLRTLRTREQELERAAAQLIPAFQPDSQIVTPEQICAALSRGQALIEMIVYSPYDAARNAWRPSRVAAYVFRGDGAVTSIDLGPAESIASQVTSYRKELSVATGRAQVQARALYDLVMAPLQPLLADVGTIYFSPDGELGLIPFGALVDPEDKYVLERYDVRYLMAARDILRSPAPASDRPAALFGNPTYGNRVARVDTTSDGNLSSTDVSFDFAPLAWTAKEVEEISTRLPGAMVYTGDQATEARVKQLQRPRILHIATHGFFIPDFRARVDEISGTSTTAPDDPLVRSGLAFACANAPCDGMEDGVLTALEATTLDLEGTELVVLSACNTGVGDAASSDGIYGLRRAFLLAGARQQLVTLWTLEEGVAKDFMVAFYDQMAAGSSPAQALRAVQLEWARHGSRQHPNYWASFVLSGR